MIQRARLYSLDCDYEFTDESFVRFVTDIGLVPEGMKCPTVGRLEHSKGYVKGNFEWQERSENSRESAYRCLHGLNYSIKEKSLV